MSIGYTHLPDLQSIGVNVSEFRLLLPFNRILEVADGLGTRNT